MPLARDNALTEIYAFLIESLSREPAWHEHHFDLSPKQATENAEATIFLHAYLFRRYTAKLQFELDFWSRFPEDGGTSDGYADRLTEATGYVYRADGFVADMDAGFYSADYLRAWIRSAQVRQYLIGEVGEDWWRDKTTGDLLRKLFWEGTQPSSEDVRRAARLQPARPPPARLRDHRLGRAGRREALKPAEPSLAAKEFLNVVPRETSDPAFGFAGDTLTALAAALLPNRLQTRPQTEDCGPCDASCRVARRSDLRARAAPRPARSTTDQVPRAQHPRQRRASPRRRGRPGRRPRLRTRAPRTPPASRV